jgi:hypothetical protein
VDLVIHGTDALLVDKVSLEKNDGSSISTIQTWGDDNNGAACLSSDPAEQCWPDISDAGYARRGVSFSMDGSWTDITPVSKSHLCTILSFHNPCMLLTCLSIF